MISCKLYFAINVLFRLLPLWLLSSCIAYKIPTDSFTNPSDPIQSKALSHPLYQIIPRHRCQIQWYDLPHWTTWMLLGNDDDGIFGEEPTAHYHPEQPPTICKSACWNLRNPLHNFFFYAVGSAHRCNSELTLLRLSRPCTEMLCYRSHASTVFADKDTSFYLALHGGKPFFSMRLTYSRSRQFDLYFGWRERGNFGMKFLPCAKRKNPLGA